MSDPVAEREVRLEQIQQYQDAVLQGVRETTEILRVAYDRARRQIEAQRR